MKHLLVATLLVVSVGVSAQSQGVLDARNQMNAAVEKGDKAAYGKFLTDDATWVDRAGRLRNKAAMVEELATSGAPPVASPVPEVRSYGNAAILVGKRRNPDGIEVSFIQAWVKNGSQWQLVTHQAIPADSKQPGSPATKPSSALPANMGSQAGRDAVQKNIDAVTEANRKGDGKMFASAVTDQFVAFGASGMVNKQDRMTAIAKAGAQTNLPSTPRESATRIHGTLAVTTQRIPVNQQGGQSSEGWRTVVTVKEGGQWKRAATVTTPITGAARPATQ